MMDKVVMGIAGLVLMIYVIAYACSRKNKEILLLLQKESKVLYPFLVIAYGIQRKGGKQKSSVYKMDQEMQLKRKLKLLDPTKEVSWQLLQFRTSRMAWVLFCLFCGTLFCLLLTLSKVMQPLIQEGIFLERLEYGQGDKKTTLVARTEQGKSTIPFVIQERQYDDEELVALSQQAKEALEVLLLGENESLEQVSTKLNLVSQIEALPFTIAWEISDYERVDLDGMVHNEDLHTPQWVTLTARLSYLDRRFEHTFSVKVVPKRYPPREALTKEIQKLLEKENADSATQDKIFLPKKTKQGEQIQWVEEQSYDFLWIVVLTLLASIAMFWAKGAEIHNRIKKREEELLLDYAEFIGKLTLYMNAGMTIRGTFLKLKDDYEHQKKEKRSYLYEEIVMTCHELQTGISEQMAYENFGKRCGLRQYVKLSALLNQNLKKGSTNLVLLLRQEAKEAFEMRKNIAKRMGEEAGTKVLGPMVMMLAVVLVMIMIPAYFSFM